MFPHTLNIEVSHHHHPVNTIAELPYAIINDEFVLTKDRLFQLVLTLFLVYDDRHQKHQ